MLGHRELTKEDIAGIIKRHLWLILTCALIFLVVGLVVSRILPPRYESQTLVIVESQKVAENYVKPVLAEDLNERLASMKEQILSRSRLEPITERFNLFAANTSTLPPRVEHLLEILKLTSKAPNSMDARIDMTRKAISITPIHSGSGTTGFYIAFTAPDPHVAQLVCGEITSLFVSENLSARELSAEGTTTFLRQQLADSKKDLDEQDGRLADFQRKYLGKLPEQVTTNANTLQALTAQLDAATQSVNHIQQSITFFQAMLAQQSQDASHSDLSAASTPDERHAELKTLIAQKKELENTYAADYPDVVVLTRRIANLRADIAQDQAQPVATKDSDSSSHYDSPQTTQLKSQLRAEQQSLETAKHEQEAIAARAKIYEDRLESSPGIEAEYKQLTRDHDAALQFYNDLLTKMNESTMATALEHHQQGEQFRVLDAPNLPDSPSFPKRNVFAAGGFLAGLFLGLLITAVLEYVDDSLRTELDVYLATKLPTLAIISYIENLPQLEVKRKWRRPSPHSDDQAKAWSDDEPESEVS